MAQTDRRQAVLIATSLLCAVAVVGCSGSEEPKPTRSEPPAKVTPHTESNLATLTLTSRAIERLGITVVAVAVQNVDRRRRLGGEVVVPAGSRVIVSAPLPGTLTLPEGRNMPLPGQPLVAGDTLFMFTPLLPPERNVPNPVERVQMAAAKATLASLQITADGEVKRSRAEVESARIALTRAQQLLQDRAGSARAADDAAAQLLIAEKTLEAAMERQARLSELTLDSEAGNVTSTPVTVPVSGTMLALHVSRGQTVSVGQPLFEVADLSTLWVKVPVYVGRLHELSPGADATITSLSGGPASPPQTARPVAAPPTANALASTADLYFEVDNSSGRLRSGQRVGVGLPLAGKTQSLTVPAGAVLYDVFGGSWVYVQDTPETFHRERIVVHDMNNSRAVLTTGPRVGTQVVVDGAAELFGTEFGTGK